MSEDQPRSHSDQNPVRIRRGRVHSVDLYEIKDSELDLLEKGSPVDVQLKFAIFLLSIAFTSIVCLSTATFRYEVIRSSFLFVSILGILLGAYLLICWYRSKQSISTVVTLIRKRMPMDDTAQVPDTSEKPSDDKTAPRGPMV